MLTGIPEHVLDPDPSVWLSNPCTCMACTALRDPAYLAPTPNLFTDEDPARPVIYGIRTFNPPWKKRNGIHHLMRPPKPDEDRGSLYCRHPDLWVGSLSYRSETRTWDVFGKQAWLTNRMCKTCMRILFKELRIDPLWTARLPN